MSAEAKELHDALEPEYLVTGQCEGHHITGTEIGLVRALSVAHGLALAGWRCRVECCDPYFRDAAIFEVWAETVPA